MRISPELRRKTLRLSATTGGQLRLSRRVIVDQMSPLGYFGKEMKPTGSGARNHSAPNDDSSPPSGNSTAAPVEHEPGESASFAALKLSDVMMAALAAAAYEHPTPVQFGVIPRALANADVLAQARTGTGKTASFLIPILEKAAHDSHPESPQAVILVPTRELAVQVRDEFVKLAKGRKTACVAIYGGMPVKGQIAKLRRHPEVVVGTPGRILDHLGRNTLSLKHIRIVVLDEADRMLDIGFRPDIERILRQCPSERQTLLLSATIPPPVERLAQRYMIKPERLDFSAKEVAVETIQQFYFTVNPDTKTELLIKLIRRDDPRQAIVFCRTKRGTERVHRSLSKRVSNVDMIHGDLTQKLRDRTMQAFRDGKLKILVATDVVGRGIDVSGISHIINYDIPEFCDDYVHRVGRTGRMGREGVAYTFVTPEEGPQLTRVENRINQLLVRAELEGYSHEVEREQLMGPPGEQPKAGPPVPKGLERSGKSSRRYRRAL